MAGLKKAFPPNKTGNPCDAYTKRIMNTNNIIILSGFFVFIFITPFENIQMA
jgi:hypothetical protein